jgi:hypothetical protein
MKSIISLSIFLTLVSGCTLSDKPYPVAPDFNAPHIQTAYVINDSLFISYALPYRSYVALWITKGLGPGEEDNSASNSAMGEDFVSKLMPMRTLVDTVQNAGYWYAIWDTKDDNGKLVDEGYYRYYLRAGTIYAYKDVYVQR